MFHQHLIVLAAIVTSLTREILTAPPQRAEYICESPACRNLLTITWCFAELPRCNRHKGIKPCQVPLVARCLPTYDGERMILKGCGQQFMIEDQQEFHDHRPIWNCQDCCSQVPGQSQTPQ
ncbi:uncharacterized protein PGTG_17454 [Puccinia graminis f. sp. tritici CRL 75-36-700-3]|uniref:CxC6 like cysteine cluster associated with KDZ domain-containing protein n=1 Tax=Puccinia graminis f. sp. tritici (strain CRL 75-36-700-3 / race SCCL) TaxID=418459 RepID=E3L592_PUCGT|nr:uncharacterized protein PGTG_17454 [Puccinia graminis f. sp. tritici CRL 75-36-700-3]EFP91717.1 hypothetical protein PGTG_17454 [Puccinia graminis f. sp. tritici CRL 75-36-700-3]